MDYLPVVIFVLSSFIVFYLSSQCCGGHNPKVKTREYSPNSDSNGVYSDSRSRFVKEGAAERIRRRMGK
jgi:hypothetical protein